MPHDPQTGGKAPGGGSDERFHVEAPARYFKGGLEGTGSITELSRTGLRIEQASLRTAPGDRIRVSFALMRTSVPIVVPCVVAQSWERGLAADFMDLDSRLRSSLQLALMQLRRRQRAEDETGLTILRPAGKSRRDTD